MCCRMDLMKLMSRKIYAYERPWSSYMQHRPAPPRDDGDPQIRSVAGNPPWHGPSPPPPWPALSLCGPNDTSPRTKLSSRTCSDDSPLRSLFFWRDSWVTRSICARSISETKGRKTTATQLGQSDATPRPTSPPSLPIICTPGDPAMLR